MCVFVWVHELIFLHLYSGSALIACDEEIYLCSQSRENVKDIRGHHSVLADPYHRAMFHSK